MPHSNPVVVFANGDYSCIRKRCFTEAHTDTSRFTDDFLRVERHGEEYAERKRCQNVDGENLIDIPHASRVHKGTSGSDGNGEGCLH